MELHGIYYALSTLPIWATLMLLLAVSVVPIQVMRNYFEGSPYDVAWSANFGGMLQALIVVIGIERLQHMLYVPHWMGTYTFQIIAGIVSIAVGVVWLKFDWHTQWADRYHHIVVFPLQIFLLATLLPVIYKNGGAGEWTATLCLLVGFIFLFLIDTKQGRLAQRPWLREHMKVVFLNKDR